MIAVDGGHRAIKYTRLGGVKKDIYSEGTLVRCSLLLRESMRVPLVLLMGIKHQQKLT